MSDEKLKTLKDIETNTYEQDGYRIKDLRQAARINIKEYEYERDSFDNFGRKGYIFLTGKIWGLREFFGLEDE